MKKILGIFLILVSIVLVTGLIEPNFFTSKNLFNTLRWTALFGIISVGVSFVIITGGIDLSIGSVIALVASLLTVLLRQFGMPPVVGTLLVLALAALLGLAHGLMITKVGLQPFVVTLCGLLIYRGGARLITGDSSMGFGGEYEGFRQLAIGKLPFLPGFPLPAPILTLGIFALLAHVFLTRTVYGRYLFALGANESAARYSGIDTNRMKTLAYVVSSLLAGVAGVLFALDINSVQPASFGNFYELYAIAAAVLGGCSLRGGEGSILGVIIGAAILRVLYNAINILGIPTHLEFSIIGAVILIGVTADELVKRMAAKRRMSKTAA